MGRNNSHCACVPLSLHIKTIILFSRIIPRHMHCVIMKCVMRVNNCIPNIVVLNLYPTVHRMGRNTVPFVLAVLVLLFLPLIALGLSSFASVLPPFDLTLPENCKTGAAVSIINESTDTGSLNIRVNLREIGNYMEHFEVWRLAKKCCDPKTRCFHFFFISYQ